MTFKQGNLQWQNKQDVESLTLVHCILEITLQDSSLETEALRSRSRTPPHIYTH